MVEGSGYNVKWLENLMIMASEEQNNAQKIVNDIQPDVGDNAWTHLDALQKWTEWSRGPTILDERAHDGNQFPPLRGKVDLTLDALIQSAFDHFFNSAPSYCTQQQERRT